MENKTEVRKKPTQPWRPASLLSLPQVIKDKYLSGYRGRFVSKSQLSKKVLEGWEVVQMSPEDLELLSPATLIDGKPLGTNLQVRELILCRMLEETALAREEYFRSLIEGSESNQMGELRDSVDVGPSGVYGSIKIKAPDRGEKEVKFR